MASLILFNKPFRVLSQFTDADGRPTLADYLDAPGFRVAGRLDYDSEGLLLLTDDGVLQQRIANPKHKQWKTYQVQVEGTPDPGQIEALCLGVPLKDGLSLPAKCRLIEPPDVAARVPPVRYRASVPDHWLELSIREGRNRQVRRMTAAVGLPTLRLLRYKIGDWTVQGLAPGEHRRENVAAPARARPARRRK